MSDKTYNRTINIFINGKEVENNLRAIEKEYFKLRNEVAGLVKGSAEYNEKIAELHRVKGILTDHKTAINGTKGAWDRAKDGITGFMTKAAGIAGVAFGAWKGIKTIIDSSERLSDGWDKLIGGAREMFTEFKLAIANVDFSNFIEGLTEAWRRGRALAEELDSLADFRAYQDYKISSLNRESRALQEIIKNRDLDVKDREAAADKREEIEKQIYDRTVLLAGRTFDIEKKTWEGRNKMAAEQAIKLYETIAEMDPKTRDILERGWGYFMGIEGSPDKAAKRLRGVGTGGAYAGISREAINQFADYMKLMESGESEVLPKLFLAFKNIENATADAQERFNAVIKERSAISQQVKKAGGGEDKEDDFNILGLYRLNKKSVEKTVKDLRKNIDDAYAKLRPKWMENMIKDAELRAEVDKEINDKIIKQREEMLEKEQKQYEDKARMYQDFAVSIGEQLGQMIATEQLTAEQAGKQLVIIALRSLREFANIYIAQGMMREVGTKGFIGLGTGTALAVIINTILSGVEAKLRSGLYTGGFTGWGGQYEPAGMVSGNVVHGQEWVANRGMVSSPVYGPMIQALEQVQRSGLSSGGYAGGAQAGMAGLTDPELKALMKGMQRLLYKLDRDGVQMEFGLRQADGVRKAMTKLNDLESSVSL